MSANNEAQFNSRFSLGGRVLAGNDNGVDSIPVADATLLLAADNFTGGYADTDNLAAEANQGSIDALWGVGGVPPTYVASGPNGKPAWLHSNNVSSVLITTTPHLLSAWAGLTATTIYVVMNHDAITDATCGIFDQGGSIQGVGGLSWSGDLMFDHGGSAYRTTGAHPGGFTNNWHLVEFSRNGDNREIKVDGTSVGTSSNSNVPNEINIQIEIGKLALNPFAGMIAEFACFNRYLTTQERADMHTYLNGKYALY